MEKQVFRNPSKLLTSVASIITILNILTTLFLGLVSFYAIGVRDPVSDIVDIDAFYRQKYVGLTTVKALTVFFIIGFTISLILWLKRKRYWSFVFLGIALLHLLVLIYCINFVWLPAFFYLFSALDLAIIVVVILNKNLQYSSKRN